jgi:acyl carrier protein
MMDKDVELLNRVRVAVASNVGVNIDDVDGDSRISEDLGADSLDIVELMMDLEEEFACDIDDDVATERLNTVQDIVDYLKSIGVE